MKLDGELAFYHSNIGFKPESQSFEFSDNNLDSGGRESGNQKVKESKKQVSTDSKRNERNLDLSTYDMEAGEGLNNSKLDFHMGTVDFKNDNEAQVRDFVEPVSHSSQDTESFGKISSAPFPEFPQDLESVKRFPDVAVLDPLEEIYSCENSDIYMDKSVTECESEMMVCYRDSNYHVIKDICIDEGVPAKDKILFENSADEKSFYKFLPSESYENKELLKDNLEINVPLPNVLDLPATEESDKASAKKCQLGDFIRTDEDATEKLADNAYKTINFPGDTIFLQELDSEQSRLSVDKGDAIESNYAQISAEPGTHTKPEESNSRIDEAILASPTLPSAVGESDSNVLVRDSMQENGSITYQSDPSTPAACGKEECHQVGRCKCDDIQNLSEPPDMKSDGQAVNSQVRHSLGESSFSAIGPVSSRINYSGPLPFSGSISLRSDSSTTSTRSFAFPILQSEWNSSPVRMAKADRRHYRKHRGWRQGLLCCKF